MGKTFCDSPTIVVVFVFLTSTLVANLANTSDVFVKFDRNTELTINCNDLKSNIQSFFRDAAEQLYESTSQLSQLDTVTIEIPARWSTLCSNQSDTIWRVPWNVANIIVKQDTSTKARQTESCGKQGLHVDLDLRTLVAPQNRVLEIKRFVREWIKFHFGVFDEFGHNVNGQYPLFYKKIDQIRPNSCADKPILGHFNDTCLTDPEACHVQDNQLNIQSSILYSLDPTKFPNIMKVCNAKNHDQDSPNQQNLLCDYNSVLEVIQRKTSPASRDFLTPKIKFVQEHPEVGIVLILDIGPAMGEADRYSLFRLGMEQFLTALPYTTKLSVITANSTTSQMYPGTVGEPGSPQDSFWKEFIFPPKLPGGSRFGSLSIVKAFEKVQAEINDLETIQVVIVTATSENNENLTDTIQFIKHRTLQVDVITFSDVRYPELLKLATYGNVYSVHEYGSFMAKVYTIGSTFLQIASQVQGINSQEVVHRVHEIPTLINPYISESFTLPEMSTSIGETAQMRVIFLLPWTTVDEYPDLMLVDPKGRNYTTYVGGGPDSEINMKWSLRIFYLTEDLRFINGTWHYKIRRLNQQIYDNIYFSVYLDVGSDSYGRGLVEDIGTLPFNANQSGIYALSVMAYIDQNGHSSWNISAFMAHPDLGLDTSFDLVDDGLVVPDVTAEDSIFSHYFYDIFYIGFYSIKFQMTSNSDPSIQRFWPGPSIYITEGFDPGDTDRIPPARDDIQKSKLHI